MAGFGRFLEKEPAPPKMNPDALIYSVLVKEYSVSPEGAEEFLSSYETRFPEVSDITLYKHFRNNYKRRFCELELIWETDLRLIVRLRLKQSSREMTIFRAMP